jgi:hypothetical protein
MYALTAPSPWGFLFLGGKPVSEGGKVAGKSSLFGKLAKIIGEISRVPKRGRNEFHKYDYVTEADLLDAVRAKLAEANVAYFFSVLSVETRELPGNPKGGPITQVTVSATFADGDTGETWMVHGAGAGQDAGDKGLYKAITGAQKYLLMKTFMVPTGDDPEVDDEKPAARTSTKSGGKSAGRAEPTAEVVQVSSIQGMREANAAGKIAMIQSTPGAQINVEGGEAKVPQGKYKDRTVNSLSLDEAEDLLGKLPKGNRWHTLVNARVNALKAGSDPAIAAVAGELGLEVAK